MLMKNLKLVKTLRRQLDRFFYLTFSVGLVVCVGFLVPGAIMGMKNYHWNPMDTAHLFIGVFPLVELILVSHQPKTKMPEIMFVCSFALFFFVHEGVTYIVTGYTVYGNNTVSETWWFWTFFIPGHVLSYCGARVGNAIKNRVDNAIIRNYPNLAQFQLQDRISLGLPSDPYAEYTLVEQEVGDVNGGGISKPFVDHFLPTLALFGIMAVVESAFLLAYYF